MPENFTPLLPTTDWNEEWKTLQLLRRRMDDADYWNERSKSFGTSDAPSVYVQEFLDRTGIQPEDTVLDMGCGNGALAIPLGERGHQVFAADFSQGMLDTLDTELTRKSIDTVTLIRMSWEDDWDAHGIEENSVDLAFASRSIATADIKDSLLRLSSVARRRACITLSTGPSPRVDARILSEIGCTTVSGYDFQYAMNILIHEGFLPEVSYIESTRKDTFDSADEAFTVFWRMVSDSVQNESEDEMGALAQRLREWIDTHLIDNADAGMPDRKGVLQKAYCLDRPRRNVWAFISWSTE